MILLHLLDFITSQVPREKAYVQHNSINVTLRLTHVVYSSIDSPYVRDKEFFKFPLLKLYFYIAGVAEWHQALDIRLNDWCRSVSMM